MLLTNTGEPIGSIKTGSYLGSSDHAMEFTLFRNIRQTKSKIRKLNFSKACFQLFRESLNKML